MKYSPTTKGFYDPIINKTIPPDAVDISRERHRSLLDGEAMGDEIVANSTTGVPELVKRAFKLDRYKERAIKLLQDVTEKFLRSSYDSRAMDLISWILITSGPTTQPARSVFDWVRAVKDASISLQDEIEIATDKDSVDLIQTDIEWFRTQYGKNGTVLANPGITLKQLREGTQ